MKMMDAVFNVFSQYAEFGGRARRAEYWNFALFVFVVNSVLGLLGKNMQFFVWIAGVFSLVIFIPNLALSVRRMHDIGKSGWYLLIELIPLIGWIIMLVWNCTEGEHCDNMYGPDPKASERY